MENEYYTPSMDEFFVGFEYEIYEDFDTLPEKTWHQQVYGKNGADPEQLGYVAPFLGSLNHFRVKFLDQKDIESLGWRYVDIYSQFTRTKYFSIMKDDMLLMWYKNNNIVRIERDTRCCFHGTIKNKSELIKLMKQIGL